MTRTFDRRTVLGIAAAAVAAASTGGAVAATQIDGTVTFEGGTAIPAGKLEIYLDDPAGSGDALRRMANTLIDSDGGAKTIAFALLPPGEVTAAAATLTIVARLERDDGWLLARGSTQIEGGQPIHIMLSTVTY